MMPLIQSQRELLKKKQYDYTKLRRIINELMDNYPPDMICDVLKEYAISTASRTQTQTDHQNYQHAAILLDVAADYLNRSEP